MVAIDYVDSVYENQILNWLYQKLIAYIYNKDCRLKRPARIGRSKPHKNHFPSVYIAWSLSHSIVSPINDNFSRDILLAYCRKTRSWVHSNFGWSLEGVPDPPIVTFSNWSPLGVTLYLFVFHSCTFRRQWFFSTF